MTSTSLPASLLRHIIDTAPGAMMVVDADTLAIVDADRNTCRLLGLDRDSLVGQPLSSIECSLQDLFFWDELRATPRFEGERVLDSEWMGKNGVSIPIEKRVTAHEENGRTYWVVHAEDLRRRRAAEAEQIGLASTLQTSLEATAEGIMVIDLDGNVTNLNRRFAEMWRVPDDLLASHSEEQLLSFLCGSLTNAKEFRDTIAQLDGDADSETENVLAVSDGRYIVCVSKPQFLRDRRVGRVFSFRNITAMKQAESDLVQARDAAEQASQVKSLFLSQMSHELRTPLNAIIGFAQLLEAESTGSTQEQLAIISRAGKHLLSVINEILDVAKIEAGKIEIEQIPFSPARIIAEVKTLIDVQAKEKGLTFSLHCDLPLPSRIINDPTRFRQILLNLCTNAVKYTEHGGIRMHVACRDGKLAVEVSDTGIGISREQKGRLFAAFSQADSSTTRRFGGTGLGLYISHQFAQMMGGGIAVDSVPGEGSTFHVTIATGPLDDALMMDSHDALRAEMAAVDRLSAIPQLSGHVLLAEDGPDNQRLITALLGKAGVDVTVVENGKQAIEQALAHDFDLILMDMQMPVMGGLEATVLLRQAAYAKPIVAVTANVMREDIEQYLGAGCSAYLSKPIDREKFFDILARHLPASAARGAGAAETQSIEDMDFFEELAARFHAGLPHTLKQLESAMAAGDWESVGQTAHTLKGAAGSFGHPQLTELAEALTKAVRSKDMRAAPEAGRALANAVQAVISTTGTPPDHALDTA